MKKLFYLALAIIPLSSCQKTNPTPTVAPTPTTPTAPTTYPMGIKYVTSTYSNFDLEYSLDTQYNTIVNKTSKIKLTYIPGDSIHYELITDAPLNHKSETIACYLRNENTAFYQYKFKFPNTSDLDEVQVFMYPDGRKYTHVRYDGSGNDNQMYQTGLILAD
jgi:hypothetical protein